MPRKVSKWAKLDTDLWDESKQKWSVRPAIGGPIYDFKTQAAIERKKDGALADAGKKGSAVHDRLLKRLEAQKRKLAKKEAMVRMQAKLDGKSPADTAAAREAAAREAAAARASGEVRGAPA